MSFGQYSFEVSDTDKVLFPEAELTKGDLIDYYCDVAEVMLPHCKGRPLTLQRFPDGIGKEGFFQQQTSDYFPDWISSIKTPRANDRRSKVEHVLANNKATLAYLANQAAVTLHGWLSREKNIEQPDRLIFDLDPPDDDFSKVVEAARHVRDLMEALGMTPHVMTTGSRGLHVVAPLKATRSFDDVRDYARSMAQQLAECFDDELTVEQRKDKREGRLYLDVMRNAYGQTAVLPYTVRARPTAPVATPLNWEELDNKNLGPQSYTIKNLLRRLGQQKDPWHGIDRYGVELSELPDVASLEVC
jgi:bifunctional non-homologous end joining protein LigD